MNGEWYIYIPHISQHVSWWFTMLLSEIGRQHVKVPLAAAISPYLISLTHLKVCIRANVAHQAGAYPGFRSMKRLGVFLLPPGWDASPSQGYPPALNSPVPIYTSGWREAM